MKVSLFLFLVVASITFAGQIAVDLDPIQQAGTDWLRYDDGTANWLTWGGMYRGVWFDLANFIPGWQTCYIEQSEFWFYHHASYPWGASDVYVEV